jgi:hypothetical protein
MLDEGAMPVSGATPRTVSARMHGHARRGVRRRRRCSSAAPVRRLQPPPRVIRSSIGSGRLGVPAVTVRRH